MGCGAVGALLLVAAASIADSAESMATGSVARAASRGTAPTPAVADPAITAESSLLAEPVDLLAEPSSMSNSATGPRFVGDYMFPEAENGLPLNFLSATRDYTFRTKVWGADGWTVHLERREPGSSPWERVDSSDALLGHVRLTIPAFGRHAEMEYRLVVQADPAGPEVVGDVQRVRHYRAEDLPPDDPAWTFSQVIAPYCQDTPVIVGDDDGGLLDSYLGPAEGLAIATPPYPNLEIIYIADTITWYAVEDFPSPKHTHVALHECAHIVSISELGDSFDAHVAAAYPDVAEEWRFEAIADALADHWAAENPGGNTSRWFVPFMPDGLTYPEAEATRYETFYPYGFLRYTGDDALVEYLTEAALRRGVTPG